MKTSETERNEKLDTTLRDIDNVVADLKAANSRQEAESRIVAHEVQGLKDLVPKALEGWKASGDAKLEDLGQEMQSLKRLLENRIGKVGGNTISLSRSNPPSNTNEPHASPGHASVSDGTNTPSPGNGIAPVPAPGVTVPKRERAIPSWQKAAADKSGTKTPDSGAESSLIEPGS